MWSILLVYPLIYLVYPLVLSAQQFGLSTGSIHCTIWPIHSVYTLNYLVFRALLRRLLAAGRSLLFLHDYSQA